MDYQKNPFSYIYRSWGLALCELSQLHLCCKQKCDALLLTMRDLWTVGQHCLFTALQQPSTLKRENFFYPKSRYFFIRICPDFRSQTWHIVYSVGYKVAIVIAKVIPEKPELSTSFSSREPLGGMTEFCIRLYICKTNRFAKPKCLPSTEKNWKHLNGVIVHFPLKWAKINTPFFLKTFDTIFFVIWKKTPNY